MDISRRAFLASGAATVGAAALAACGDDDDASKDDPTPGSAADTTTGGEAPLDLPENDTAELIALFDPMLAPLGQHVTRVGLFDLAAGFVRDDRGTHMAVYAEPIDPEADGWDDARYIDATAPGMAAITPFMFQTWSDLQSMDLCQEPPHSRHPEEEPPIETQVFLTRADSAGIDWDDVDLAALLEAKLRSPDTARVSGRPGIEAHPSWTAALAEARAHVEAG